MIAAFLRRLTNGTRRVWHAPDWPEYAGSDWCERIMSVARPTASTPNREGRSPGGHWGQGTSAVVYLKRHYRLPRLARLAALFPADCGAQGQEWHHLEWAKREGCIAAGGGRGRVHRMGPTAKFLAVEELTDMLPLHEAIPRRGRAAGRVRGVERGLIAEMARIARAAPGTCKDCTCAIYVPEAEGRVPANGADAFISSICMVEPPPASVVSVRMKDLAQPYAVSGAGVQP